MGKQKKRGKLSQPRAAVILSKPTPAVISRIPELYFLVQHKEDICVAVSVIRNSKEDTHIKPQLLRIEIDSITEKVLDLKQRIASKVPIPADKQKLTFKGGLMNEDGKSLAYYNLKDGDIIFLEDGLLPLLCVSEASKSDPPFIDKLGLQEIRVPINQMNMPVRVFSSSRPRALKKSDGVDRALKKLHGVDGWEDEWDRFYDSRGKSKTYLKNLRRLDNRVGCPKDGSHYFTTLYKSRGYDPEPEWVDLNRMSVKLEKGEKYSEIVVKGAKHAINIYNEKMSRDLEYVKVTKAVRHLIFEDEYYPRPFRTLCITFEAQEEGKPYTAKLYQTRVYMELTDEILEVTSFRPKPMTRS